MARLRRRRPWRRSRPRYAHRLLLVDVAIGASLVLAVAAAATRRRPPTSNGLRVLACFLVAVPLPLAVTLHLLLPLSIGVDEALFVGGAAAFAAGAFLLLGRDDDSGLRRGDDVEPPWWPEFERGFRCYSSGPSRRPERTRVS
jgi:hypothetical protein